MEEKKIIAIGADHGGIHLKADIMAYLDELAVPYKDYGTYSDESVDYPDIAKVVGTAVLSGEAERGILICGTGIGIGIAANKMKGIRAALCHDVFSAKFSRAHNDANILTMGERVIGKGLAREIVHTWLTSEFEGGRHERRVKKIHEIEA